MRLPVPRVLLAAFVGDLSVHVALGSFSYRAEALGVSPGGIGLIGGVMDLVYTVIALTLPRVADARSRAAMIRCAAVTMCTGAALAWQASTVPAFVIALAILRGGTALYWPTLEARLSDEHHRDLGRAVSAFSLSWSLGKALGYGVNALAFEHGIEPRQSFLLTAAGAALLVFAAPADHERPADDVAPGGGARGLPRLRVLAAWVGVFFACGAFIVLQNQNAPLMKAKLHTPAFGNFVLAVLVGFNVLMFEVLRRRPELAGSDRALLASGALLFSGLAAAWLSSRPVLLLGAAALIGTGMGLAYTQSLFLSLRLPHKKSVAAGIHEAFIGGANAALAPLAGVATEAYGNANGALLFALGLVGTGCLFVGWCLKRTRRVPSDNRG